MAKKPPHFIWHAYVALSQMRTQTADEAIEQLLDIWPAYPVRELVRAEGDERLALELIRAAGQGSDNGQDGAAPNPEDMNAIIRAKAGRGRQPAAQGADGQLQPRDDDFIRQRYTERYRQAGQGQG